MRIKLTLVYWWEAEPKLVFSWGYLLEKSVLYPGSMGQAQLCKVSSRWGCPILGGLPYGQSPQLMVLATSCLKCSRLWRCLDVMRGASILGETGIWENADSEITTRSSVNVSLTTSQQALVHTQVSQVLPSINPR